MSGISRTQPENLVPNRDVSSWIKECAELCEPAQIRVLDGSATEKQQLIQQAIAEKVLIELNQQNRPGCYLHRSHTNDVARTEECTFICTPNPELAGPTNNWMDAKQGYAKLRPLFQGCMRGRIMYVIPFVMGPIGSPLAQVGVQVSDSVYVAISMGIMTRMGSAAWDELRRTGSFTRCLHSVAQLDPKQRYICHFPLDNTIWSINSGYGGNALLGKKCMALRIASYLAYQQGWMAEHMLLLGATDPKGEKTYVAGAFPSACGKTNFAMLTPPEKYQKAGWKITTVGDDIAWMYVDQAGFLRAINPEAGYFGVIPGTSVETNPNAMKTIAHDTLFTNVALLPDGDVWWEGKTAEPPAECIDWTGERWTPASGKKAAHPNSRFTAPMANNPVLDPAVNDPAGVPISAILFGGRRSSAIPLVYQAFDWSHGVYLGAMLGSETTAAATGQVGVVRRDPMAMLPFCGYNAGLYLQHWLRMGKKIKERPRIFHVNWFRKSDEGKFLWPGFGENMRVLKWVIDRSRGRGGAVETPLGWMPRASDIDLDGISPQQFTAAQTIQPDELKQELTSQMDMYVKLSTDMPRELILERELMVSRL